MIGSASSSAATPMRLLLLFLWFLFIASAASWIPAYRGDIGGEEPIFVLVYAVVAGIAAIGVRGRAPTVREALLSALPAVGILGVAAVVGVLVNNQGPDFRGEQIFLYLAVALWGSWAALMLAAAFVARTKWDGFAGIALGFLVAMLGLFLFTAQID